MEEFLRDSPRDGHDFQLHVQEFLPHDAASPPYQDPLFDFDTTATAAAEPFTQEFDPEPHNLDELILPNHLYQTILPQQAVLAAPANLSLPQYFLPPAKTHVPQMGSMGSMGSMQPQPNYNQYNQPPQPQEMTPSATIPINNPMAYQQMHSLNLILETQLFLPGGLYLLPQTIISPNLDNLDHLRLPTFALPIRMLTLVKQEPLLSPPPSSLMALLLLVPLLGPDPASTADTRLLSKEEKMKRRREFHNAVERRRRDLIKEKIKELGVLVPPLMLSPQLCAMQVLSQLTNPEITEMVLQAKVKETKPNKATILNKLVEYINHLKYVLEQQERERARLQQQVDALSQGQDYTQFNPDEFFSDMVLSQFSDTTGDIERFF